jgi:hypothetical protein
MDGGEWETFQMNKTGEDGREGKQGEVLEANRCFIYDNIQMVLVSLLITTSTRIYIPLSAIDPLMFPF